MSAQPALFEPVIPAEGKTPELLVTEILSPREAHVTWAIEMGFIGMTLRRTPSDMAGTRFMWIEFELPNVRRSTRALVEVMSQDQNSTQLRFKHMWPRDRALYEQYVAELLGLDGCREPDVETLKAAAI